MGRPSFTRLVCALYVAAWGMVSLSGVEVVPDRRKIEPLLQFRDAPAVEAAQSRALGAPVRPDTVVPVFIRVSGDYEALADEVRNLGGTARRVHPRIFAARIPRDSARYLSNRPRVLYIEAERIARPVLDASRPAVSADDVQLGVASWPAPLDAGVSGTDIFVGIVDTGLSAAHPDFSGRAIGVYAPLGVDPLRDTSGHGTHVAGIAAGDGAASAGLYTGMAPGAQLLIGRAGINNFPLGNIFDAIDAMLTTAGGNPIAINLSLGVPTGPHDGTSSFETIIDDRAAGDAGSRRIIAVAAGNERDLDGHFRATIPPFGATTAVLTLDSVSGATAEFWADGTDRYTVTATLGGQALTVPSGNSATVTGGAISVSNRVSAPPNGATLITVFFRPSAIGQSASILLARTRNGGTGAVDGYVDVFDAHFSAGAESGTITEPANAENVVAVGSFNTKSGGGAGTVGEISTFSGFGPTRDGRMKPDLAAPGSLIYSARSLEADFDPIEIVPPPNDEYVILQGTSMASPHVAGIAALVWESNLNLTGAQMRERLRRTADPVLVGGASPNTAWGFGKVNALRAVDSAVAGITVDPPPGVSAAAIPPGTAVTLRGDEKSSGAFGEPLSYSWSAGAGGTLGTPASPTTTFSAPVPGDYPVTLAVSPGSAPYNQAAATVHVNTAPVAAIAGPSSSDNVAAPATFSGLQSADPDGGALTFHWVMVARPDGSANTFTTADVESVTFTPDRAGTYEIGLRVDDGLDNSALATVTFTSGAAAATGGGGGCSVTADGPDADIPSAAAALVLFLLPVGALRARRMLAPPTRRTNARIADRSGA